MGSTDVLVAVTDTGIDYTHPDLYLNIAIHQAEIPHSLRSSLLDVNGDGLISFHDLNDPANAPFVSDLNANGVIDAGDLIADPRWADGIDDDANGRLDDLVGWNFITNTNDPWDGHWHGTHVSGTIAAQTHNGVGVAGVAPNVRILPLKNVRDDGSAPRSASIAAISYATELGARVINASWGGTSFSQAMHDTIQLAAARNAVFVAAAGNNGRDNDATPFYPASYNLPNVLSVAAITSSGARASFSNFGVTSVDLGAPGSGILSTMPGGGYSSRSGTSMAAPHVTGVAALVASSSPGITSRQVVDLLLDTTRPLASLAGRTLTGGMVDAFGALSSLPADPPPSESTPPSAPTSLTANARSSSQIALSWDAVPSATSYILERSTSPESGWTIHATLAAKWTSFLDEGLLASTTYSYRVRAVNDLGSSDPSNNASATTLDKQSSGGKRRKPGVI
jgi:subtilisin family serine protease